MATTTDQPTLVRAQVRHLRCSARKARVILDHVRGLSVMQAEATLQFSPRAAARDVLGPAPLRHGERQGEPRHRPGRARDRSLLRRRGPDAQALQAARARPRLEHPQAHVPRHDRAAARRRARAARHLGRPGHDRRREPPRPHAPGAGHARSRRGGRGAGGRRGRRRPPPRRPPPRRPRRRPGRRASRAPPSPRRPRPARPGPTSPRPRPGRASRAPPKPAAKPEDEPAAQAAGDAAEKTADEGDS